MSCERLRDHVVDLQLQDARDAKDSLGNPVDLAPHKKALRRVAG